VRRFPVFNRFNYLRRLVAGATYKLHLPFNDYFRAWYNGPIIPSMTREIARAGADLVVASSFPLLHMQYALRGAQKARAPIVLIGGIHLDDAWGFDSPLIYRTLKRADHVIAYTRFERDALIARAVPAEKITVTGLGVEPTAFLSGTGSGIRKQHNLGKEPVIGYIGQQVAHKGIDTLIASMTRIWPEYPATRLLIAGSRTSFSAQLEAQVERLPPSWRKRVTFVHNFEEASKPHLYAACDILVLPSIHESFGLSLLEAWAAARPVVACRDSAPGSIVTHEGDGLLVGYRDQEDLATALRALLAAPERRRQMGHAGQRKVLAEYTWSAVVDRIRSVYARVLSQHPSHQSAGRHE
jgi:glycosyltransferase involved in cell wall biosynthesis